MKDGKFVGIVSMMVRTPFFLRAVGLEKAKAGLTALDEVFRMAGAEA